MKFQASPGFSVGIEIELQLLDAGSLDLAERILPVIEAFPDSSYIKAEFVQDTVEVLSSPHAGVRELEEELSQRLTELLAVAPRLELRLAGGGTHPFGTRLALVTPTPRYERLQEEAGLLGHTQIAFGTHVHVGMPNGDEAVMVMGELRPYLPLLLVLSANSPYWRGYETRFASYRQCLLAAMRSYGQPPVFSSWEAFVRAVESMVRAGVVRDVSDLHWDLRPQPELGTLEVRILDTPSRVAHAVQLAACIRALVRYLQHSRSTAHRRSLHAPPWWIYKANAYAAARFGREARLMTDADGSARPAAELIDALFEQIDPFADDLGERHALEALRGRWNAKLDYERQEEWHRESGSLREVTRRMAADLDPCSGARAAATSGGRSRRSVRL